MSILVGMPWLRQLRVKRGTQLRLIYFLVFSYFSMQRISFEGSCCKVHRPMKLITYRKCIERPIMNWCGIPTSTKRICFLLKSVFTFDDHTVAHFQVCWKLIEQNLPIYTPWKSLDFSIGHWFWVINLKESVCVFSFHRNAINRSLRFFKS